MKIVSVLMMSLIPSILLSNCDGLGCCMQSVINVLQPGGGDARGTKVIAHRGYWDCKGSAQNSMKALRMAQKLAIYGSEFDVSITSDGVAVVNHDSEINGLRIDATPYAQLANIRIGNGERLPTLSDYLETGRKDKNTRLVLEIKPHATKEIEDRAVGVILELVRQYGLGDQVDFISFSLNICKELIMREPGVRVAYLNGDLSPQQLKESGFWGLDYHYKVLQQHKDWVAEAKELGLTVNVWTVNSAELMREMIGLGVDFITTDKPVECKKIIVE